MKKSVKILVAVVALVFLSAGCGKTQPQASSQQPAASTQDRQVASAPSTITSNSQTAPRGQTQVGQNSGSADSRSGYVTVTQIVQGSTLNQIFNKTKDGSTAFDLLNSTHQVVAKDYGSMGEFVQSIDGLSPDSKHFWAFYLNGVSSNVGSSAYKVQNGDKIEWKLEVIR